MTAFHEVQFGSPTYHAVRELRDAVLRRPPGLARRADFGPADGFRHFALLEGGAVVACAMGVPREPGRWQIRQMAVLPPRQGKGLGRQLLTAAEAGLFAAGATHLYLFAREHAIGFYAGLGYIPVGERFEEIGLPHQRMEKALRTPA